MQQRIPVKEGQHLEPPHSNTRQCQSTHHRPEMLITPGRAVPPRKAARRWAAGSPAFAVAAWRLAGRPSISRPTWSVSAGAAGVRQGARTKLGLTGRGPWCTIAANGRRGSLPGDGYAGFGALGAAPPLGSGTNAAAQVPGAAAASCILLACRCKMGDSDSSLDSELLRASGKRGKKRKVAEDSDYEESDQSVSLEEESEWEEEEAPRRVRPAVPAPSRAPWAPPGTADCCEYSTAPFRRRQRRAAGPQEPPQLAAAAAAAATATHHLLLSPVAHCVHPAHPCCCSSKKKGSGQKPARKRPAQRGGRRAASSDDDEEDDEDFDEAAGALLNALLPLCAARQDMAELGCQCELCIPRHRQCASNSRPCCSMVPQRRPARAAAGAAAGTSSKSLLTTRTGCT